MTGSAASDGARKSPVSAGSLGLIAAVAVAYFAAAKFGLSLAFATKQVTAIWPPTGIALVALIFFGYRVWPGIFLGAFVANALSNEPWTTAAGIAAGNMLTGVVGAALLRGVLGFERSLERTRDVLGLVLVAAVSTTVSASNGVANLALGGIVPWSAYGSVWWVWWVGDTLGILVVAPFLLTWAAEPQPGWRPAQRAELAALFSGLVVVGYVVFLGKLDRATASHPLAYAAFPLLIWAGLRFGLRETMSAALLVSGVAIWGAIHDRGPFATGTLDQRLILLNIFIAVTEVTALLLGAVTAERRHSQERLHRAHDQLEARVRERTAELARANVELRQVNEVLTARTRELAAKNEEVEAFVYIVSHDLRAPLVNLQGFSKELETSCRDLEDTLRSASLPASLDSSVQAILKDGIAGALRFITASTTKFQRLIDALLALSRSGKQEYRAEAVDVRAVVDGAILSLHHSIQQHGASVSIDALPPAIGDTTAIGQVFSNLIGNALNYLHPGRNGRIEIGGESPDGVVHYWVRDNGVGIPSSAQRRLFQVFQRFHPDLAQGEGMGLAIVKRVVERHRGRIWADSEEGVGSTFHVTLPAAGAAGAPGAQGVRKDHSPWQPDIR